MTTPDDVDATGEQPRPDVGRQERAVAATREGDATVPGLVISEERLADGRHITYFGVGAAR